MKIIPYVLFIVLGALLLSTPVLADYCNMVESGSSFTGSKGVMTSSVGSRFIGDSPVETGYNMQVNGAVGTASSFFNANLNEGRGSGLASNLIYRQRTTASGIITGFSASYSYRSGMFG